MKKLSVLLLLTSSLFSCSKDCCETGPLSFPTLRVVNSAGTDLLDPTNSESYDTAAIQALLLLASGEIKANVNVEKSKTNTFFILQLYIPYYGMEDGISDTNKIIFDFSENKRDTLTWFVEESHGSFYSDYLTYN